MEFKKQVNLSPVCKAYPAAELREWFCLKVTQTWASRITKYICSSSTPNLLSVLESYRFCTPCRCFVSFHSQSSWHGLAPVPRTGAPASFIRRLTSLRFGSGHASKAVCLLKQKSQAPACDFCFTLSRLSGSNRGPIVYKTIALPTELRRHILLGDFFICISRLTSSLLHYNASRAGRESLLTLRLRDEALYRRNEV